MADRMLLAVYVGSVLAVGLAIVWGWVEHRNVRRLEAELEDADQRGVEAYRQGYDAGFVAGEDARPWPESFYQPEPEPVEAPSEWALRVEDDRLAWCQRVGIPFEHHLEEAGPERTVLGAPPAGRQP